MGAEVGGKFWKLMERPFKFCVMWPREGCVMRDPDAYHSVWFKGNRKIFRATDLTVKYDQISSWTSLNRCPSCLIRFKNNSILPVDSQWVNYPSVIHQFLVSALFRDNFVVVYDYGVITVIYYCHNQLHGDNILMNYALQATNAIIGHCIN